MEFTKEEFIKRIAVGIFGAILALCGWEFEGRYPLLAIIIVIIGLCMVIYCLYFLFTVKMKKDEIKKE